MSEPKNNHGRDSQETTGRRYPTISVVIPSFNQAEYLERTILSVLGQNYPGLELIIIDGGSTDGSVEIIERYAPKLAYWVAEPDGGQTRGLIKGFSRATGEIQCWLNSDDLHEPRTLHEVGEYFMANPSVDAVYGNTVWIDRKNAVLREQREMPFNRFVWIYTHNYIPGMSLFWRKSLYDAVGGLNPDFDLAMDADLIFRFSYAGKIAHANKFWSCMRFYAEQKNLRLREKSDQEDMLIRKRYWRAEKTQLYGAKRFLARAFRVTWRLATGCYSLNYRVRMDANG